MRNRLGDETSPYLLQHKDDPVFWQPWDTEALALAQKSGKPILLSVGYAACHWCHVMHHESFADPEIAKLMNELFVSIKVDREERPDIDAIYMNALHLLGQHGGWPMTMFLKPDGTPFWGGTYFPPAPRHGQPAFADVLRAVHRTFTTQSEAVEKNSSAIKSALDALAEGESGFTLQPQILDEIARGLVPEIDQMNGGLRGAPKFPQTPLLELLWRAHQRTDDRTLGHAVTMTLEHMCQGGIYDHLGGGFARYTVDDRWLVPHFEKMLYDNASLVELLALVFLRTGDPLFEARVRETISFLLREMKNPEGGFAASLDADSEGEEGKFYVWSAAEIVEVLGRDALLFSSVYDVTEAGNWEGTNILNRLNSIEPLPPEQEARLANCRKTLLEARAARIRPGFDDKVLVDWNGLTIAALVRAAQIFEEPAWLDAAKEAFAFVCGKLGYRQGERERLHHSYRLGRARHQAIAEGYANMARAALLLEEATDERHYLDRAMAWVETLEQHYRDERGGYYLTADDGEALVTRSRFAADHPVPNANGTMIEVLTRLYFRTGDEHYRMRALGVVSAFSSDLQRHVLSYGAYLNGFDFLSHARQIVIVGEPGAADTEALRKAAIRSALPQLALTVLPPGQALPELHPASGKTQSQGRATAYVCRGTTCSLPVVTAEDLAQSIRTP